MQNTKLVVGLTGAVHPNMPGDDKGVYRQIIKDMEKLKNDLNFDLRTIPKPLETETDGRNAREFFDDNKVDFTMIFNASLPFGRVILPLARVNSYIGLWSVPEPTRSGVLQLNSFCGLNMLGSIIGNYLKEHDINFKWFYGYPDTELFLERFKVSLKAMRAIKSLKQARIGGIGDLANGFENLQIDERILEKRFGTYIQLRHTVEDIVTRANGYDESRISKELGKIEKEGEWVKSNVSKESMNKFIRVSLALYDFAKENDYDALCISCWTKFQEVYNIAVCGAMSRLNQAGIVAPCERDVPAAVNMLIFNAMNRNISTLKDLVALDEEDTSINLWHCGVAPKCWANEKGLRWDAHFNIGEYINDEWRGEGVIADLAFKEGRLTVCTMDNSFNNLFIMTGDVMVNKKGYSGGSGWVNNLEINGKKISIRELINTISVNRVNHHYPVAFGDLTDELNEFANWIGLNILDPVPYRPYLQNRPL